MNNQPVPRVGQRIATVKAGSAGALEGYMTFWLQQCLKFLGRNPNSAVATTVVGVSPFTYQNTGDFTVDAVVTGGTVSAVQFSRDGTTFYSMSTGTQVTLNPGDYLRVTYTVLPTLTLIPR